MTVVAIEEYAVAVMTKCGHVTHHMWLCESVEPKKVCWCNWYCLRLNGLLQLQLGVTGVASGENGTWEGQCASVPVGVGVCADVIVSLYG